MLGWDAYHGQLGANAVNHALHVTGTLSLVFLFLALVITPLRWATGWGGWVAFRRALGLYAFFYSIIHLGIYIGLDRALSVSSTFHEIWTRRFLQVGVAAVLLMVPLAVTSTNGMVRRLGPKRWKLLHRAVYLVAALGVLHYYMLVKSDVGSRSLLPRCSSSCSALASDGTISSCCESPGIRQRGQPTNGRSSAASSVAAGSADTTQPRQTMERRIESRRHFSGDAGGQDVSADGGRRRSVPLCVSTGPVSQRSTHD